MVLGPAIVYGLKVVGLIKRQEAELVCKVEDAVIFLGSDEDGQQ